MPTWWLDAIGPRPGRGDAAAATERTEQARRRIGGPSREPKAPAEMVSLAAGRAQPGQVRSITWSRASDSVSVSAPVAVTSIVWLWQMPHSPNFRSETGRWKVMPASSRS